MPECPYFRSGRKSITLELGSVVWARFGKTAYHPAVVIREELTLTGLKPKPDHVCVFWLSSLDVSQIKSCYVQPFPRMLRRQMRNISKHMTSAVTRGLQIEAERGHVDTSCFNSVLEWGIAEDGYLLLAETRPHRLHPPPVNPIPEFVMDCLKQPMMVPFPVLCDKTAKAIWAEEMEVENHDRDDRLGMNSTDNVEKVISQDRDTGHGCNSTENVEEVETQDRDTRCGCYSMENVEEVFNQDRDTSCGCNSMENVEEVETQDRDTSRGCNSMENAKEVIIQDMGTSCGCNSMENLEEVETQDRDTSRGCNSMENVEEVETQDRDTRCGCNSMENVNKVINQDRDTVHGYSSLDIDMEANAPDRDNCLGCSSSQKKCSKYPLVEGRECKSCKSSTLELGSLVWARFGKTANHLAVVICEELTLTGLKPKPDHVCVFWLSSLDVSQIKSCYVQPFPSMLRRQMRNMSKHMTSAVTRGLQIEAERGHVDTSCFNSIMEWGVAEDGYLSLAETRPHRFHPPPVNPIPEFVMDCLKQPMMVPFPVLCDKMAKAIWAEEMEVENHDRDDRLGMNSTDNVEKVISQDRDIGHGCNSMENVEEVETQDRDTRCGCYSMENVEEVINQDRDTSRGCNSMENVEEVINQDRDSSRGCNSMENVEEVINQDRDTSRGCNSMENAQEVETQDRDTGRGCYSMENAEEVIIQDRDTSRGCNSMENVKEVINQDRDTVHGYSSLDIDMEANALDRDNCLGCSSSQKKCSKYPLVEGHECKTCKGSMLQLGSVVWARFGKNLYHPAVVIHEELTLTGLKPKPDHVCVFWLSSLDVSQIKSCYVQPFPRMLRRQLRNISKHMTSAVTRGLQIEAERGHVDTSCFNSVLEWGVAEDGYLLLAKTRPHRFHPPPVNPIPEFVMDCLKQPMMVPFPVTCDKTAKAIWAEEIEVENQDRDDCLGCNSMDNVEKVMSQDRDTGHGCNSMENVEEVEKQDRDTSNGCNSMENVEEVENRGTSHGYSSLDIDMETNTQNRDNCLGCSSSQNDDSKSVSMLQLGSVVWARFGKTAYHPAVVIREELTLTRLKPKPDHVCVFWLSSLDVSQIKSCYVQPFASMLRRQLRNMSKQITSAVTIGLQIEAERGHVDTSCFNSVLDWVVAEDGYLSLAETRPHRFHPSSVSPVPRFVLDFLKQCERTPDSTAQTLAEEMEVEGQGHGRDGCLGCSSIETTPHLHPLFEGPVCTACKILCSVCGLGGKLVVCDQCTRSYCSVCIIKHTSRQVLNKIEELDVWSCFLCEDHHTTATTALRKRMDSSIELIKFSDHNCNPLPHGYANFTGGSKRKIRVLSLYDGIGTGKLVLDQLGLVVDRYFACEIDRHAVMVSSCLAGVEHLGDVCKLTPQNLERICPIDLVIGGPPCNDLSLVNPNRKGFEGSGRLTVKFKEILCEVQRLCQHTNHVFYLMESTGNMPVQYKEHISQMLGLQPAIWDAKYFTGMKRKRFFWGNIPGLQSMPLYRQHLEVEKTVLADVIPSVGGRRTAMVSETRTITTHTNSHTIVNGEPTTVVTMDGKNCLLYPSELESLFGFPAGYTDCRRTNRKARRKLIGKSWCVQVVREILLPLRLYFKWQEI